MVHGALTRDCVFGLDNEENTNSGDTDTQGQSDHRDTNSANQSDSLSNSASRAGGEMPGANEEICTQNCTWGQVLAQNWQQIIPNAVSGVSNQSPLDAAVSEFFGSELLTEGTINIVEGDIVEGGLTVASGLAFGKFKPIKRQVDKLTAGKAGEANAVVPKKINNSLIGKPRSGSANKLPDGQHGFNDIIDNYAGDAARFDIPTKGPGGKVVRTSELRQIKGSNNGVEGIFEWVIDQGNVTHRRFIPNGAITGLPNQIPKKQK